MARIMSKTSSIGILRPINLVGKSLLGLTMIAGLAACATQQPISSPSEVRYPIEVVESIERLELYTRPNGLELSSRDTDAVALFVNNYRRFGNGPLHINVPQHTSAGLGAQQAQSLIAGMLGGRAANVIARGQYAANPNAPAPVVISYRHLKTLPRECGFFNNLTATGSNRPDPSFGCIQSANLAAMIQDPRQLIEPLPLDRADIQRRIEVYDRYIAGEDPSSDQPPRQVISADGS